MLCSKCQTLINPVVIFDIDGTLGDYHSHFWDFARMYLGIPCPDDTTIYDGSRPYSEWFCDSYDVDITTFREIKLAYRQGGQKRTMPMYPEMNLAVHQVRKMGCEIWMATTRPYLSLSGIDSDTRFWLNRHNIDFDYLLYDEKKYKVISERVDPQRVIAVVDDEFSNLLEARSFFDEEVLALRCNQYNVATAAMWAGKKIRFSTDLVYYVDQQIKEWKVKNG